MRGPPPKPTLIKERTGNPGRRKLNQDEPKPGPATGDPPDWLPEDARRLWFRIAAPMIGCRLATAVDETTLARYCVLYALWLRALASIEKSKATFYPVKNKAGAIVGHREFPAFAELRRLGPQLTALEREFGLTPASRTRIRIEREAGVSRDGKDSLRAWFLHGAEEAAKGA